MVGLVMLSIINGVMSMIANAIVTH